MKILMLTKYGPKGASSRLRTMQYVPWLEQSGIHCDVFPLISDEALTAKYSKQSYSNNEMFQTYWNRIRLLQAAKDQYDLIWIEKEALPWTPAWFEKLLLSGVPYVLDYDDALFHNYDMHRLPIVRKVFGKRLDSLMASAKLVVCGNQYLADRAHQAGAKWIEIIPTVIDIDRYFTNDEKVNQIPTIVWIGSPSTAQYVNDIARPLSDLAKEIPYKLRIIGAKLNIPGVNTESLDWSENTEVPLVAECDIGIMPLPDTPWTNGKCGYKLIQYMACGLPVVGSDVGANKNIVEPDANGFLVNDDAGWLNALKTLLQDRNMRQRYGARGRQDAENLFCIQKTAPRLSELLRKAATS
ncbi:glycosyltransferase family 4 protein [Neisseria wadsworthii]|uniref:Group 1 glycosyl transferase n=1 Tax=Neisseria wadsworthii 9715 TaxID=1030841 RepID=G4CPN7_9NEIS|nr:glycosyltransferase family 4 protein [Neisseria wadsworthii]EGZ47607.1 group 1 glycosyl transferase [Neisseria wadsworthii 9715]QMT34840.1 glycosyltransferase family 4 protein [Neisseria wadsworthii]